MQKFPTDLPVQAPEYDLKAFLDAGCHFGHQTSKWNPKMSDWIYTQRQGIHIFDLAKTAAQLQRAYDVLHHLASQNKNVLVVATKRQAQEPVISAATKSGMHYITSRWMGGFLTNWDQVSKSIRHMNKLDKGLQSGEYDSFTKYERVQLEKELTRLKRFFAGVAGLSEKPACLIVVDVKREEIAVKEAQMSGIPIIALVDSNSDPDGIAVPIPANDDAVRSIEFIINELAAAYASGKKSVK